MFLKLTQIPTRPPFEKFSCTRTCPFHTIPYLQTKKIKSFYKNYRRRWTCSFDDTLLYILFILLLTWLQPRRGCIFLFLTEQRVHRSSWQSSSSNKTIGDLFLCFVTLTTPATLLFTTVVMVATARFHTNQYIVVTF